MEDGGEAEDRQSHEPHLDWVRAEERLDAEWLDEFQQEHPEAQRPERRGAMCAPHESQPLRNPEGDGNALRTQTYAPPEASGRPEASSAYDIPASIATSAAIARLRRTNGPATVYVAPTSRKMAAPTMAPTAAIVTSKSPRSRVTRTRTEPAPGPREATRAEKA